MQAVVPEEKQRYGKAIGSELKLAEQLGLLYVSLVSCSFALVDRAWCPAELAGAENHGVEFPLMN